MARPCRSRQGLLAVTASVPEKGVLDVKITIEIDQERIILVVLVLTVPVSTTRRKYAATIRE